jgi:hypothetical protein
MHFHSKTSALFGLPLAAALMACDPAPSGDSGKIDVLPASLDEAEQTIRQIEQLMKSNPNDRLAIEATKKLGPRLDELNHLVARIEPKPGHFVSFYETLPGSITVAEKGPANEARVLETAMVEGYPVHHLYRLLTHGAEPPVTLVEAGERDLRARLHETLAGAASDAPAQPASSADEIWTSRQQLTSGDGVFWRDSVCYKGGDIHGCLPNWSEFGWAEWTTAKTSFFQLALFAGSQMSIRMSVTGPPNGGGFIVTLFNGEWGTWWAHSARFNDSCFLCAGDDFQYHRQDHRWETIDFSGKQYHFTYAFKYSCNGIGPCNRSP